MVWDDQVIASSPLSHIINISSYLQTQSIIAAAISGSQATAVLLQFNKWIMHDQTLMEHGTLC